MISQRMMSLGKNSSVIREIYEYGRKRKAEIGDENVFDFSLGNPSIPAPEKVNEVIRRLTLEKDPVSLHGYTSSQGDIGVRRRIADSIRERFGVEASADRIYMTCGAAASLTITLHALCEPGDEVILLVPCFPEYRVFTEQTGAKVVTVRCRAEDFQIDFDALRGAMTEKTKAIIVNSPNNPTGVVLSRGTVERLSALLREKEAEYGTDIYIISDEPYRELSYGCDVPYIPCFYENTVVCYSYSKSLSLPGERIGYIFVSPLAKDAADLFAAVCGAGRALGYVCAPSMLQYVVGECLSEPSNLDAYIRNRDLLYGSLCKMGYTAAHPDGAFYLFLKALEDDAIAFCERAKKYELLLVPSNDFGYEGYVRIAYCVDHGTIERSLPAFRKLMEDYQKENNR